MDNKIILVVRNGVLQNIFCSQNLSPDVVLLDFDEAHDNKEEELRLKEQERILSELIVKRKVYDIIPYDKI